MHQQARQLQWRLALVTQAAPHRQTIRAHHLGFGVLARGHGALALTHAPHVLVELSLRMPIGSQDRLTRLL